ncbi:DUF418 domain-containing protein [Pseudoalteromonas ruthenica]|uniref:DUF418 domain-containing protein n=1 Tax=Pseudoalteromonas ruthenica TaxID=151081 RepID=UPI00241FB997|nr:DUF418 domain-containing protein [Pseudoalteromonas ruthenica]
MSKASLFAEQGYYRQLITDARRTEIDALRGLAILGLLFLNAPFFIYFDYGYIAPPGTHLVDSLLYGIQVLLLDGRFRGLFVALFVVGLIVQWQRRATDSRDEPMHYLRVRLYCLAVIGLVHGMLLWAGDILLGYALAGLLLVTMLDSPAKQQLRQGILFIVVGSAVLLTLSGLYIEPALTYDDEQYQGYLNQDNFHFLATRSSNAINMLLMTLVSLFSVLWLELGAMLLIAATWRSGFLSSPWSHQVKLSVGAGLLLCLLLSGVHLGYGNSFTATLSLIANSISGTITALVALHWLSRRRLRMGVGIRLLANVGRLSLSCYLAQSALMLVITHYFGLYIAQNFALAHYALLAFAIIIVQLLGANAYLRIFTQGPAEWAWRKAVQRWR